MITANDALTLLHNIGYEDLTTADKNLLSERKLDSIAIMNLISAIEDTYGCEIDFDLVDQSCFEDCDAIAKFIEKSLA